jgi:dihydrolipoamide dehydrogenase
MLAHTASREADVCIKDMIEKKELIRYETIPSVIYTHPEVAAVGLKEDEAISRGIEVHVAKMPFTYSGRFWAETEPGERSLCKAIIDKNRRTLVGCHMVGPYASEMIVAATMMIEAQLLIEDLEEIVFPHPTVVEMVKETILSADIKKSVYSAATIA